MRTVSFVGEADGLWSHRREPDSTDSLVHSGVVLLQAPHDVELVRRQSAMPLAAASAAAAVVSSGTRCNAGGGADVRAVGTGPTTTRASSPRAGPCRSLDQQLDGVAAARPLAELVDDLAHHDARCSRTLAAVPAVATISKPRSRTAVPPAAPVALSRSASDMNTHPVVGKRSPAASWRLGERQPERQVDAHDLAGGAHLGTEHRIGVGEPVERQHRLLDRDVVAGDRRLQQPPRAEAARAMRRTSPATPTFTSGTPVALATNGTVRDARGIGLDDEDLGGVGSVARPLHRELHVDETVAPRATRRADLV
jgi:hypothetical protein